MSEAGKILVCFALPEEAVEFRKSPAAAQVEILVTGMGPVNARRAFEQAISSKRPLRVLTCGYAGGLSPQATFGRIVFEADADEGFGRKCLAAGGISVRFVTMDRVLVSPELKASARAESGADAVDMESGIIRQICREKGIWSATVRVVSDAADESLPMDFNRLTTKDSKMNFAKLAMELMRRPALIPRLLAFRKRLVQCSGRLSEFLAAVIVEPGAKAR